MVWIPGKPRDAASFGVRFGDKGGGGGGTQPAGNTTTTSTSEPWAEQKPYLTQGFQSAQNIFNGGGAQYFPGQTIAPQSQATLGAQNMTANRAMSGSPVNQAAQGNLTATLNGDYLNKNPYLDATFNQAAGQGRAAIDSQFAGAGRYGSGAQGQAIGQLYSNLGNQIYGGNYQAERQRQIQGLTQAPQIANQDYVDASQLANVGAGQDQYAQNNVNANIDRYNYNQNLPLNNLANYMRMVQGNYGGSATQTTPFYGPSTTQQAVSGGLLGLGLLGGMGGGQQQGGGSMFGIF